MPLASTQRCMYGFTILVPFQSPAPSHLGNSWSRLVPAIKDTGFPTLLAVRIGAPLRKLLSFLGSVCTANIPSPDEKRMRQGLAPPKNKKSPMAHAWLRPTRAEARHLTACPLDRSTTASRKLLTTSIVQNWIHTQALDRFAAPFAMLASQSLANACAHLIISP